MAGSSDIFLSYAKSDSARAQKLADALQQEGLTVWWDHKIRPGKPWADVIEDSIKKSRCVVVLWSSSSIQSKWVKKEARFADRLERLVPALIDAVELPFEFEHVQAADLTDWEGTKTAGFADLVAELQSRVQTVSVPSKVTATKKATIPQATSSPVSKQPDPHFVAPPKPVVKNFPRPDWRTGSPSRRIGSKQAPNFWASPTGSLLVYLAAIAGIWGIGILGGYLVAQIASYLKVPALSAAFFSWTQRVPSLPTLIGLGVEAAIAIVTWFIADDELPMSATEYMMVAAKAIGFALVCALGVTVAFRSPTQAWLRNFAPIAVSTAALTASAYAISDELF